MFGNRKSSNSAQPLRVVVAIYDSTTACYASDPVCHPTIQDAVRAFKHACRNEKSIMYSNPEDFSLFHIGSFNQGTGEMISVTPVRLLSAHEAISQLIQEHNDRVLSLPKLIDIPPSVSGSLSTTNNGHLEAKNA